MYDMGETPSLEQTLALSKVGQAYNQLESTIRFAMAMGISAGRIAMFLEDPATQQANRTMRKIIVENADTDPTLRALNGIVDLGDGSMLDAATIMTSASRDGD
jgi:hypothetical protein